MQAGWGTKRGDGVRKKLLKTVTSWKHYWKTEKHQNGTVLYVSYITIKLGKKIFFKPKLYLLLTVRESCVLVSRHILTERSNLLIFCRVLRGRLFWVGYTDMSWSWAWIMLVYWGRNRVMSAMEVCSLEWVCWSAVTDFLLSEISSPKWIVTHQLDNFRSTSGSYLLS